MNNVMILIGAGQIGLAIARRTGSGKTIIIADKKREHAEEAASIMRNAGFNATAEVANLASRDSILELSTSRISSAR